VDLLRSWRAVRHLRPGQVTNRVARRLRRPPASWGEAERYGLAARRPSKPAGVIVRHAVDGSFRFLNETRPFEGEDRWRPRGVARLWAEQLHAFRWLWELPPGDAAAHIALWLDENPPASAPGWAPAPTSVRVREWIEWLLLHPDAPEPLRTRMVASLAHQARTLEATIEHHLLGHHVLENAITLCWAGLTLQGPSAGRWVARGRRLLRRQLGEQVLADGTHDERSPMYQALLAEALLRLAEVAGPSRAGESVRSMARAGGEVLVGSLRALSHPDGQIALLNDAAFREAPAVGVMERRFAVAEGEAPEDDSWALPSGGYYGVRRGELYVAFDAGPIGPDHQPAHGHADALSFELSHDGRRIFTDTGVLTYEAGTSRSWDRGTAAHNTVQVDGLDQSELWGAFGCGRRIHRVRGIARRVEDRVHFGGSYVGVAAGGRRLEHRRECAVRGDRLVFSDQLEAAGEHEAALRLHVGPGLDVERSPEGPRVLDSHLPLALVQSRGLEWSIEETPYHPEFGVEVTRRCLVARARFRDRATLGWDVRLL
jgi:hypothetical protein